MPKRFRESGRVGTGVGESNKLIGDLEVELVPCFETNRPRLSRARWLDGVVIVGCFESTWIVVLCACDTSLY